MEAHGSPSFFPPSLSISFPSLSHRRVRQKNCSMLEYSINCLVEPFLKVHMKSRTESHCSITGCCNQGGSVSSLHSHGPWLKRSLKDRTVMVLTERQESCCRSRDRKTPYTSDEREDIQGCLQLELS